MSRISPSLLENTSSREAIVQGSSRPDLQSVHVTGTVHGLLLEMHVEQTYINRGTTNIEIAYSFPLPHDAVLLGMEFTLGDRTLHDRVVACPDAEEQYEVALEGGHTAVMLERAADGVYTANVGNLLGREKAVVRIRYAHLLSVHQGQVRMTVPNVIAPRYGDPAAARLRLHQLPTHDMRAAYPFSLSLRLHGPVACGRISSPSHALAVRKTDSCLDICLAQPNASMLDRSFVLLSDGLTDTAIATVGRDDNGYVALASFCPPPAPREKKLPVKLKILVDCSGSMNGDSMKGARKALHEVLAQLNPDDRFSYSRFGSQVAHHSHALMSGTPRAVLEASTWIAQTAADMGNTEIREALLSTYALGQPMPADILLITDGAVWDTEPLVASALKSGQRVFAVGVGAAPAASLLQRLAAGTGGSCELTGANDDVHAAVLRMFKRMRQPPTSAAAVTWDGETEWTTEPGTRIFRGETVHAFAGFATMQPTGAQLRFSDQGGNTWEQRIACEREVADGSTLARVAAAHRLPVLPAAQRHALALHYELLSATTNILIVHERAEEQRAVAMPALRVVPQMPVAGRSGIGNIPGVKSVAVWRRDTASEQIQAMMRNSVEDYEKPAFLRKQTGIFPFIYREQLRVFLHTYVAALAGGPCPEAFADIEDALPGPVLGKLQDVAESGYAPGDVIRVFIAALHDCFHRGSFGVRVLRWIGKLGTAGRQQDVLEGRVIGIATAAFHARHAHAAPYDLPAFLRKQAD